MSSRTLTETERNALSLVLAARVPVTVDLWGEGQDRWISFYGTGTRLEARINYPDEKGQP